MTEEIKSSNIKLKFGLQEVEDFVASELGSIGAVVRLVEGHTSQAFAFTHESGTKRVLRIAPNDDGFLRDRYAFETFSSESLPIPKIFEIDSFKKGSFYCISQFVEGKTSDKLTPEEMASSLDNQLHCFAHLFKSDLGDAKGWGEIDIQEEKAPSDTWQEGFLEEVEGLDEPLLTNGLVKLGLDKSLYGAFRQMFETNMANIPNPVKRLVHGDLGFDNVLVADDKVTAIIDWADIGYGDWVFDMARCHFWHPGKYGDIREFGERFDLDCDMLDQRINTCIAFVALTTLDYALRYESDSTINWLKTHLKTKLK